MKSQPNKPSPLVKLGSLTVRASDVRSILPCEAWQHDLREFPPRVIVRYYGEAATKDSQAPGHQVRYVVHCEDFAAATALADEFTAIIKRAEGWPETASDGSLDF